MNPVLLEIGPFSLNWYGLFIVGGAAIAAWLSSRYATKAGENPDHIWNLLAVSLVFGIIGARIYHVFSAPADELGWLHYRENPYDAIDFWSTGGFRGLGIYGGLVGGVFGIVVYCWWQKLNPIKYLDLIAPNVLIAQALGRMGNLINQELYGLATDLPWAFHINPLYPCQIPTELPETIQFCGSTAISAESAAWYASNGFHPTFSYEAGWNVMMFALLTFIIWRFGSRLRRADGVWLYLIAYSLGRLWVGAFRPDEWIMGRLATAQWIAIGTIVFSGILLIVRHRGWTAQGDPDVSLYLMSGKHRNRLEDTLADST